MGCALPCHAPGVWHSAGAASGELFEDEGDGYGFQRGDFLLTRYSASTRCDGGQETQGPGAARRVRVEVASQQGGRARPSRPLTVRLLLEDDLWVRRPASGIRL